MLRVQGLESRVYGLGLREKPGLREAPSVDALNSA